jgi:hypothetical protein
MSASTSARSAESRCPLPLGTRYGRRPVHRGAQSSRACTPEVNVIEGVVGWQATLANPAAGSPVRPLRSLPGLRYPSASVESAAPPSVEELRQVVPVSDMRGRLGAGPARCRMAGGDWLPTEAAGSSVSRCEPSNALLPPAARQARGSVDNMRVVSTYRPRRLGRVRPGLTLDWFRAALHHSAARRTNGHTALTTVAHRFHLTCAICRAAPTC